MYAHADFRRRFLPEYKEYGVASMPYRISNVWMVDVPLLLLPFAHMFKSLYKSRAFISRFHICGKGDPLAAELLQYAPRRYVG